MKHIHNINRVQYIFIYGIKYMGTDDIIINFIIHDSINLFF